MKESHAVAMEKYHYKSSEGVKITVPWPGKSLRARDLRALKKIEDVEDRGWAMLEKVADEENFEKVLDLLADDLSDFFEGWNSNGKVATGESSAS